MQVPWALHLGFSQGPLNHDAFYHPVLPNFWNVLWGHQRAYQSKSSQESSYISSPVSICSMVYPPESINWRRLSSSYSWTDLAPARLDPHVARIINWPFIMKNIWLVVPTPLKNMSSSVGIMTFPIYGKIKAMFQSTNQTSFTSLVKAAWLRKPQRNFGQLVCPNPPCPGAAPQLREITTKNMERSRGCFQMVNNWHGMIIPNIWGKKQVPNHQPGKHGFSSALWVWCGCVKNWERLSKGPGKLGNQCPSRMIMT